MIFLDHFFDAFYYIMSKDYGMWFLALGSAIWLLYFVFQLLFVAR